MLEPTALLRPSVVALAATAVILAACQGEETSIAPSPAPAPTATPVVTVAPAPTLDRAGLLQAMDEAASAFSGGREVTDASLVGRRFLVRQAFGCGAPAASPAGAPLQGLAGLTRGAAGRTLKLALAPGDWTASPPFPDAVGAWEAAEGFWLSWPWLRGDGCPRVPDSRSAADETTVLPPHSPQTAGLAAVFEKEGSRLGRRNGRAYEFTIRGEGDLSPVPSPAGYRFVLEGRMAAFEDGSAIRCRAPGPEQRPACIGAVRLERVAFETAEGKVLSEWRG